MKESVLGWRMAGWREEICSIRVRTEVTATSLSGRNITAKLEEWERQGRWREQHMQRPRGRTDPKEAGVVQRPAGEPEEEERGSSGRTSRWRQAWDFNLHQLPVLGPQ